MAVSSSDILLKYSTTTGPGNSTAGAAGTSLGQFISTTQITSATLNNLFDDVSGAENLAEESEYRCIFIHNNHATDDFLNVKAYILSEVADGADIAIGDRKSVV